MSTSSRSNPGPTAARQRSRRRLRMLLTLLAFGLLPWASPSKADIREPVTLQFLNVSDWHGQLDPISVGGVNVGGAAFISTYWKADRAANPNTVTLTAGDDFGATPPLSLYFNDEPAVLAERLMGIQANTFGNHNFDHGTPYLQHLIYLAASTSAVGNPYSYVDNNLKNIGDNLAGVAPWTLVEVGGVKVGVVGVTNFDAPSLLFPGDLGTMAVTDPVPAANQARAQAQAAGAKVTVCLIHEGITGFDADGNPTGPLIDFANNVGHFDIIFGDHTDVQWSGMIANKWILENRSKGATYARTFVTVDPKNGRVIDRSTQFVVPSVAGVTPDPAIVAMLAPYRTALGNVFGARIGVATDVFVRGGNIERRQEVPIGDLISDSMRARYGTQLALTNGGGIRAPLPSSYLPADHTLRRISPGYAAGPPYDIVLGDIYTALPFGNVVDTRIVTGAQLWAALENGVSFINPDGTGNQGRFPQISGFRFTYTASQPAGSRVLSVTLDDGTPILPDGTTYTFATNDFVNSGGDGYTVLNDGQGTTREVMADVLVEYIEGLVTIIPTTSGRITRVP